MLFAVNVTAVLPATPSNLGVFQAACVAVLTAYGVGAADALAYGIILQAVEIATAIAWARPALVKEGLSWREVRLRAMHASPVELAPAQGFARRAAPAKPPDARPTRSARAGVRARPPVVGLGAAISASFSARVSRLIRASSRRAALASAIGSASASSTGRRERV